MTRSLPPLNALRAFEAAARHLSFKNAAAELLVTPAAVSHQVKALEAALGVTLFERLTRALRLTAAGQAALPLLSQGFDALAAGAQSARAHQESGLLTISVSPSFGAMWLVPRLDRFQRLHPEIEIRIDGTDRLVDVARGEADVAIRYGQGGYDGLEEVRLFAQFNTPVCSPDLLNGAHPLRRPSDLRHHTLLHVAWKSVDASWRMWLLAARLHNIDSTRGPLFSEEAMAVQAALDGQGVALIGDQIVAGHLATGRLVTPFDSAFKTPLKFSYFLLTSPTKATLPKVAAFRAWIAAEVEHLSAEH